MTLDALHTFEQVHVGLGSGQVRLRLRLTETSETPEPSYTAALLLADCAHERLPLVRIVCDSVDDRRALYAETDLANDWLDSPWTDTALSALGDCAARYARELRALGDEALAICFWEGARRRSRKRQTTGGRK